MAEPRLVSEYHLSCKDPKCTTCATVRAYECGCRRVEIFNESRSDNSCMKTFRGLRYTAPGCEGSGTKFIKDVGYELAKKAAVAAISAAVTGGAVVISG